MKRREFLTAAASTGLAGAALPCFGAIQPCPPPAVTAGSAQPVATSCNPPPWFTAIAPGTWGAIPSSVLNGSSAQVNGCYTGATGGWQTSNNNVIDPWCGGFINTVGITAYPNNNFSGTASFISGTFVCLWGGGHAAYQGDEVYCFGPLESNAPQWYCPRPATNPPPPYGAGSGYDSNGNPVSAHTYSSTVYVPPKNSLYVTGLNFDYVGDEHGDVPIFNFATTSPATNQPWNKGTALPHSWGASQGCVYDSVNNGIWGWDNPLASAYGLNFLNLTTNTWSYGSSNWLLSGNSPYYITGAIDTKRGVIALWGTWYSGGETAQQLWFFQTNNGVNNKPWRATLTGAALPAATVVGSILYDPVLDSFVVYPGGAAGASLYTVTAPSSNPYQGGNAWTVAAISGSGTPIAENPQGTWGRFGLIPSTIIRGYTLVSSVTGSVYLYRP